MVGFVFIGPVLLGVQGLDRLVRPDPGRLGLRRPGGARRRHLHAARRPDRRQHRLRRRGQPAAPGAARADRGDGLRAAAGDAGRAVDPLLRHPRDGARASRSLFIVPALSLLALMIWFGWLGFTILDRVPQGPPARLGRRRGDPLAEARRGAAARRRRAPRRSSRRRDRGLRRGARAPGPLRAPRAGPEAQAQAPPGEAAAERDSATAPSRRGAPPPSACSRSRPASCSRPARATPALAALDLEGELGALEHEWAAHRGAAIHLERHGDDPERADGRLRPRPRRPRPPPPAARGRALARAASTRCSSIASGTGSPRAGAATPTLEDDLARARARDRPRPRALQRPGDPARRLARRDHELVPAHPRAGRRRRGLPLHRPPRRPSRIPRSRARRR